MIDKAIEKITKEAMEINDPLAFAIEECLTKNCTTREAVQKILAEDKKLADIHDQLIKHAQNRARPLKGSKGRGVYIDIEPVILSYYGIDANDQQHRAARPQTERTNVLDLF